MLLVIHSLAFETENERFGKKGKKDKDSKKTIKGPKKVKLNFNTQMGKCMACIDECSKVDKATCAVSTQLAAVFHIANFKSNQVDIAETFKNGMLMNKGCKEKATEADLQAATVIQLCCQDGKGFEGVEGVKVTKKNGNEIVGKGDAKVKIAKCIMCNSKHQPNFIPQKYKLTTKACPKDYIFAGRIGVNDEEQFIKPADAQKFTFTDKTEIEYYKNSKQSIIVGFRGKEEYYKDCQIFDVLGAKEKDFHRYFNLFDGYKADFKKQAKKNGGDTKLDDGNKENSKKITPLSVLSWGYNLCCNAIDDAQKQPICEMCTSCDPETQVSTIVFKDMRDEDTFQVDKTNLFKGEKCKGYYDRSVANADAISKNVDGSIDHNMWKLMPDFKDQLHLCCQKHPRFYS